MISFVRLRPNSTPSYSQNFPLIICRIRVRALQCWYCIHSIVLVSYLHPVDLGFFESLISFFVSIAYLRAIEQTMKNVEYMRTKWQGRTCSSIMLNGMLIGVEKSCQKVQSLTVDRTRRKVDWRPKKAVNLGVEKKPLAVQID